jgi:hypothetical protein
MSKVNGRQTTTDAKWWQKLTLPLARWANNKKQLMNMILIFFPVTCGSIKILWKDGRTVQSCSPLWEPYMTCKISSCSNLLCISLICFVRMNSHSNISHWRFLTAIYHIEDFSQQYITLKISHSNISHWRFLTAIYHIEDFSQQYITLKTWDVMRSSSHAKQWCLSMICHITSHSYTECKENILYDICH